jgi:chromosome segregation ATPase
VNEAGFSGNQLDEALTERLARVVAGAEPTEAELRTLAEGGEALARALAASIRSSEARLTSLSADPSSAVSELAAELRRVELLRGELDDLRADLAVLDRRARALRGKWLARPRS